MLPLGQIQYIEDENGILINEVKPRFVESHGHWFHVPRDLNVVEVPREQLQAHNLLLGHAVEYVPKYPWFSHLFLKDFQPPLSFLIL